MRDAQSRKRFKLTFFSFLTYPSLCCHGFTLDRLNDFNLTAVFHSLFC